MRLLLPFRLLVVALAVGLVVASLLPGTSASTSDARVRLAAYTPTRNDYQAVSGAKLAQGTRLATTISGDAGDPTVVLASDAPHVSTPAGTAARGSWTSPWVTARTRFTQLIPSWRVTTPVGTWIQVFVRVRTADGRVSSYDALAQWAPKDDDVKRTSYGEQSDDLIKMATDTVLSQVGQLSAWQVDVALYRRSSAAASPAIHQVGAVATLPGSGVPATSAPWLGAKTLAVPSYSQMIHRGEYPQYGNGGEAWCSPTSTSMLLGYYHALPGPGQYTWVSPSYRDRWVDHIARRTYDYGYRGTGNWGFNTSMASYVGDGFVTRLQDLRQVESLINHDIPVAASISFASGQLSGAPISASNGHLVVISGFTSSGNVVVNDPAAPSDSSVRRIYDRAQFERAWLGHSLGTVYLIHDAAHPLPSTSSTNW